MTRQRTATRNTRSGRAPAKATERSTPRAAVKSTETRERGGIQSIQRAAAILDAVARHSEGVSLAGLTAELGLHTSTTFHLVKTLATLGLIAREPGDRRYRIGSRVFTLAAGALDENTLLSFGTPILERLSADTGEAAHLAVRSRHEIAVVARTSASGLLQLSYRSGITRPAHATAIGKMLISAMPPGDLDGLLATLPLPALTPNTITGREALKQALDEVRRRRVAYDDCELDVDVRCVAVPVYDFAGRTAAAMGLSGPAWRLSHAVLKQKLKRLRMAAAELSAELGFRDEAAS
jgi:DNA-binding IclR family transcriptional regulator